MAPETKRSLSVQIYALRQRLDRILDSVWFYAASLFLKLLAPLKKTNNPTPDNANEEGTNSKGERAGSILVKSNPPPTPSNQKKSPKGCRKGLEIARFVVEILGLVGLSVYVGLTYEMWQVAQDTLRVSQRAYVTIGKQDGVVAEFIKSQNPQQAAELVVYFQNSGHLPAKLAWGTRGIGFIFNRIGAPQQQSGIEYNHMFTGLPVRTRNKKDGGISEFSGVEGQGTQTVTIAGNSIFAAPIGAISEENLQALLSKDIQIMPPQGMFQYCDELGTNETHEFLFGYRNAASPSISFYLVKEGESLMDRLPKPTSTSTIEYLSPCETIRERQENQEKIEQYNSGWQKFSRWLRAKIHPSTVP